MARNHTWEQHKFVSGQQFVAICTLSATRKARNKPAWIWDVIGPNDVHAGCIVDCDRCQHVRSCVEDLKPLVDGNLKDGRCRVNGAVDCSHTL